MATQGRQAAVVAPAASGLGPREKMSLRIALAAGNERNSEPVSLPRRRPLLFTGAGRGPGWGARAGGAGSPELAAAAAGCWRGGGVGPWAPRRKREPLRSLAGLSLGAKVTPLGRPPVPRLPRQARPPAALAAAALAGRAVDLAGGQRRGSGERPKARESPQPPAVTLLLLPRCVRPRPLQSGGRQEAESERSKGLLSEGSGSRSLAGRSGRPSSALACPEGRQWPAGRAPNSVQAPPPPPVAP